MQNMLFNHIACLLCIFGIPGSGAFLFVSAMVVPEYIEIIQVIAPVIAFILFILLGILFVINIMRAVKLFMTIKSTPLAKLGKADEVLV